MTHDIYQRKTDRIAIDAISHASKSLLNYGVQSINDRQMAIVLLLVVDARKAFDTYSIIEENRYNEYNESELSEAYDAVVNAVNILRDFEKTHVMPPAKIDGIDNLGFPIPYYFE